MIGLHLLDMIEDVEMDTKRDSLLKEMKSEVVNPDLLRNISELMYTASETGVLPFRMDKDDLESFLKIYRVAAKYNKIPETLRM